MSLKVYLFAMGVSGVIFIESAIGAVEDSGAFFRDGQTFVTWREDGALKGEKYRIYRHTEPINPANFAKASLLAEIPEGSSKFEEMWDKNGALIKSREGMSPPQIIPRLCIENVGADNLPKMLSDGTGLFVGTAKNPVKQEAYYAVTTVADGVEKKDLGKGSVCGPVSELKEPIGSVHYITTEDKAGKETVTREWRIMWMDYELWNHDYLGYAFPFAITKRPGNEYFKEGGITPTIHLDGIGTMNVFTAQYTKYGIADFAANARPTWYFGFGRDVKNRADGLDVKQEISNYNQYRLIQVVLWARRHYKLKENQFNIDGNSMGASGAIGLALTFPDFVSSIWANQGMSNLKSLFSSNHLKK